MKKIYNLLFLAITTVTSSVFAQTSYIKAPPLTYTTATTIGPNGTSAHATQRGCFLIKANELSVIGTNTAINSIGFYLNTGTGGPAVTGTIQIYLQNTNDALYNKGLSFTTATAPMTSVYNSTIVLPATGGSAIVTATLPSAFNYTGGALYVAYDWVTTGPFAGTPASYQADNNTLAAGGAINSTTVSPASNNLSATNTRPLFQIGYVNTYTNEASVYGVLGNGRQPLINGAPYTFSCIVKNNAGVTMTNISPTLTMSGANVFSTTTNIASLAAGASTIAIFPAYTPTTQGMSTVSIAVPVDENNTNNTNSITHSVTCNYLNTGPNSPIANFSQGVGLNGGGLLLNRINVATTSSITALRLGIANYNPNAGNAVYGVLTNSNGVILATTNTVVLTSLMFSTYQTFTFPTPQSLTGGLDYFIGLAQPFNATPYFPVASMPSPSNNIPANLYGTSFIGGGFIGVQTPTLGWFAMESVFYNGITLTVTPVTSTICSGTSLTLTANGATSYSWSNGAATATTNVSPNLYTVYTATGSAVVGTVGTCEDIKTSTIFVNLTPVISAPNGAICPVGGSFTLNPSGAATYTFSGGSPVVSPSVTSNYTITGTSGAGCVGNTVVATVSVQPSLNVTITGQTLVCEGESVGLTASGAVSYSWNVGSPSNIIIITPTATTNYTVVGTFGSCTNAAVATVSVNPQLTVTAYATPSIICIGNTGTLIAYGSVGAGPTTYSWDNGASTQSIAVSPSVNTTYTVVGVSNGVCSSTAIVTQSVISCVGIQEHNNSLSQINVYPNPNNGLFTVFVSSVTDNSLLELYNCLGQIVVKQKINDNTTILNLNTLSKGIYILKLKENNQSVKTTRVVIQ
jgi:hypothetical protein